MDVSVPDRPLRRLAWGAIEGIALGAVLYLAMVFLREDAAPASWRAAGRFLLFGLVGCAAGQVLARGIIGACAGAVAGALLGSALADDLPRQALARHHISREAKLDGITLDNTHYNIESRRGHVVLVDFWATWCPPCRGEVPRLKKLYEQYHSKGFEIVGVSLDESRTALADFVKDKKMPWPQIVAEQPGESGWKNPALDRYTVRSIPYTLLVDREGRIVASGLVGEDLEDAIERVMAGEPVSQPGTGWGDPITIYCATFGCFAGILVQRRLRQVAATRGSHQHEGLPTR
jgi:thiol-disulfide isomerase/thioredoxin